MMILSLRNTCLEKIFQILNGISYLFLLLSNLQGPIFKSFIQPSMIENNDFTLPQSNLNFFMSQHDTERLRPLFESWINASNYIKSTSWIEVDDLLEFSLPQSRSDLSILIIDEPFIHREPVVQWYLRMTSDIVNLTTFRNLVVVFTPLTDRSFLPELEKAMPSTYFSFLDILQFPPNEEQLFDLKFQLVQFIGDSVIELAIDLEVSKIFNFLSRLYKSYEDLSSGTDFSKYGISFDNYMPIFEYVKESLLTRLDTMNRKDIYLFLRNLNQGVVPKLLKLKKDIIPNLVRQLFPIFKNYFYELLLMDQIQGECMMCSSKSSLKCGGCFVRNYCSELHQKLDWKVHRVCCRPFQFLARSLKEIGI